MNTIEHFRTLYDIAKTDGVKDALLYDVGCTARRNPTLAIPILDLALWLTKPAYSSMPEAPEPSYSSVTDEHMFVEKGAETNYCGNINSSEPEFAWGLDRCLKGANGEYCSPNFSDSVPFTRVLHESKTKNHEN